MEDSPQLYVILDVASVRDAGHTVSEVAADAYEAGARLFQCRFKGLGDDANAALCRQVLGAVGPDAVVVVNGRPDIAASVEADGVHLRSSGGIAADVREVGLPVVGRSCHSVRDARRAADEGADFITISPIFRSQSKPDYGPLLGVGGLHEVCEAVDIPVYALAGITPERVEPCLEAGAHGVAVMSGICGAEDIAAATTQYLNPPSP